MAHDIFISYSHKDKTVADAICSYMENEGMRCWYAPRDILPGTEWGEEILKGIEAAKIMILVFTKDANLSQQVLREVNNAVNAELTIIPFRLTEEEPAAGMKYYLSTVHWMDAMNQDLDHAVRALASRCKAVLDAGSGSAEPDLSDQARSSHGATAKKNKTMLIAAVCIVAVLAVVAVLFMQNMNSSSTQTSQSNSSVLDENLNLGAISENVSTDLAETYTRGNNQGNILNGGYFAYDTDTSMYYYRSNDEGTLYRMNEDGTERTKLTENPVSAINIADGYVYFVAEGAGLQRVSTTGTNIETLTAAVDWNEKAHIIDDRIYFGELGLFSMKTDGSDYRNHNNITGYEETFDGIWEYYEDTENSHLYRVKMDGSTPECIYDHETAGLRIAGNYLFFYDVDLGQEMKYDLLTGKTTVLFDGPANRPVATKDGLYYQSGQMQLEFYSFDTEEITLLSEDWVNIVHAAGNKIFYENSGTYYVVNTDGSNKMEL